MLKLRQEHLDAFEAMVVGRFHARVIEHVNAVWPQECEELGETVLTGIVRDSIQRATFLGFTSEHDVVRFVDLSFILSTDFDVNPLARWMKSILIDRTLLPGARMDRLYQRLEIEFALIEKRHREKA